MKSKHIHFIGIKGVGVTPLAIIAKEAGFDVTGCDIDQEFITDEVLKQNNITICSGFSASHLVDTDIVIMTTAHGQMAHEEVAAAQELSIPVYTQAQAVALFMEGSFFNRKTKGISISGTHGKTTTTAMLATILSVSQYDPTYIIGSSTTVPLGASGHYGKGEYVIAEADEYAIDPIHEKRAKFLLQHPKIIIITNIEFDHPDVYDSLEDIEASFLSFVTHLPSDGLLVYCGDSPHIAKIMATVTSHKLSYGYNKANDYCIEIVSRDPETVFDIKVKNKSLGTFTLSVFGDHNVLNATAALIVAHSVGIAISSIKHALLQYKGVKRRLEYKGVLPSGAVCLDDYAHHPTEIQKTLDAVKTHYGNKKIICIFQPHTYSRTKQLFEQFITSFMDVHAVIITPIYSSAREEVDATVSSSSLVERMQQSGVPALFLPTMQDVVKYIHQKAFDPDYIIITMGAGDIYTLHDLLFLV